MTPPPPLSQVEDNQISITDPTDTGGGNREPKAFSYDFSYDWTSTQEGVHLDLGAPIVTKALQGYNGRRRPFVGIIRDNINHHTAFGNEATFINAFRGGGTIFPMSA